MKAHASTLAAIGLAAREKRSRYRARRERPGPGSLVDVLDNSVPFSSVERLADRLGIETGELLKVIGVAGRTAIRRKAHGHLRADEADRLLRVARVLEEGTRVFGTTGKAATWLRTAHPLLGDVAPYRLLDSDAGAKAVSDELVRIDFGDFA
jgi:putative toxin-antitoxin system antitoxin component (TIGR02293 family)